MAIGYVVECSNLPKGGQGNILPILPPLGQCVVQAPVTYTTAVSSAATATDTEFVDIISDGNCHISIGLTPTATTSDLYLPATQRIQIGIKPGHKVSFIAAA